MAIFTRISANFVQILCRKMKVRIILLSALALALASCSDRYQVIGGYAQGGVYSVKYTTRGVKV